MPVIADDNTEKIDEHPSAFKVKKSIKAAIFAAVIIIVALIEIIAKTASVKPAITLYRSAANNSVAIFFDDKLAECSISGTATSYICNSDKSVYAVLAGSSNEYNLYIISDKKVTCASKNATNKFCISSNGSTVLFYDNSGTLNRYDVKSGSVSEIEKDADKFTMSPDGSYILYDVTKNSEIKLYMRSGSKSKFIADNYKPIAISDKGKYIYAENLADNSICILNTDGTVASKLCSNADTSDIYFNSDLSEIVFTDGSYTYYSSEGKSKMRIANGKFSPITGDDNVLEDNDGTVHIYGMKSLLGRYYSLMTEANCTTLSYVDKNGTGTVVSEDVGSIESCGNGKAVFRTFTQDGLWICKQNQNAKKISDSNGFFTCTSDGKYVYYSATDGLYVYKNGKSTKISDEKIPELYMTNKDVLLFTTTDHQLYSAKGKKVGDKIADNVFNCKCEKNAAFFSCNYAEQSGYFTLYCSDGSDNFTKAADKITWIK